MKKLINLLLVLMIGFSLTSCKQEKELPIPSITSGMRGQLGIDDNINETNIDEYLSRKDSVYRDMRMLFDEADYAAIGGDSAMSGVVKGFEVVPFPYLCNVESLPQEVGSTYSGVTLFTKIGDEYVANFKESLDIIEQLFPRDKVIFLMCGGGGYAGMMKNMLVGLGYDSDKIYNVGGYWYYQGKNNISTVTETNGVKKYDFSKIIYHDIDFSNLTQIREINIEQSQIAGLDLSGFKMLESLEDIKQKEQTKQDFLLFIYLPNCSSCKDFLPIVKEFMQGNDLEIYAISLAKLWDEDNSIKQRIAYSPSLFIYKQGEVAAYLDPASDQDLPYYQDLQSLCLWAKEYIDVKILSSDTKSNLTDCTSGCELE